MYYIAETVNRDFANKLQQGKMFSVLNDSSTDISVTDEKYSSNVFVKIYKTHYLATSSLELGQELRQPKYSMSNQTKKKCLVHAPQATGHKNKFQTLSL